jgi:hypothetical protein
MEAPGLAATSPTAGEVDPRRRVRPYRPSDLEQMAALDAAATGEDRRHLLETFASPESSRVVVGPDDVARGFVVRATWGGGATVADDPDDAMALLEARRRATTTDRRVRAGVLDLNVDGIARLEITGKRVVRNLWNQKNEGLYQKKFVARVPSQGVVMIKIMKK